MKNSKIHCGLLAALLLLVAACAKQGMPSGGPKDETPPKVLRMHPENRTMNYNKGVFQIEFDEYVVIKDAENNILVSPPMQQKPEYKTKGKSIVVRMPDTLQENTTYVFQFKQAIADYNEGNLLPTMEYVFSTGNYLDSMTIRGRVVDALTHEAREEVVSVWLMTVPDAERFTSSWGDSAAPAPSLAYATRCDKNGSFVFNYIRPNQYTIFAVVDENKNQQLEANEGLAFRQEPVMALNMKDSIMVDSVMRCIADSGKLELLLFTPKNDKQRITGSDFIVAGKARITTQLPMVNPIVDDGGEKLIWRLNDKRDTMTLWTLREKCDSLRLVLSDASGLQDTLKLRFKQRRGLLAPGKAESIKLNYSQLPYFEKLRLNFTTPLDTSLCQTDSIITIIDMKDSSIRCCSVLIDSTLLSAVIQGTFLPGGKYTVDIHKGCFQNIYRRASDTLHTVITVTEPEQYGNLTLKIDSEAAGPFIVQLLGEKGAVVHTRVKDGNGYLNFQNLTPGKYRIRAILDENANGEWDTGDFALRRQPERVVYMSKTLEVRANWEYNEELRIEK